MTNEFEKPLDAIAREFSQFFGSIAEFETASGCDEPAQFAERLALMCDEIAEITSSQQAGSDRARASMDRIRREYTPELTRDFSCIDNALGENATGAMVETSLHNFFTRLDREFLLIDLPARSLKSQPQSPEAQP